MAVLLEQPEKIKECGIAEKWWTKKLEEDERTRIVGCAAARLNDALKKGKKLDSFTNAADKGAYVQKIKAIQVEWAKFRVPEAAGTALNSSAGNSAGALPAGSPSGPGASPQGLPPRQ